MNVHQQFVGARTIDTSADTGVTVSVIAWKSAGDISFDWFYSESAADRIFEVERGYCHEVSEVRRSLLRCELVVSSYDNADSEVKEQIAAQFAAVEAVALESLTLH